LTPFEAGVKIRPALKQNPIKSLYQSGVTKTSHCTFLSVEAEFNTACFSTRLAVHLRAMSALALLSQERLLKADFGRDMPPVTEVLGVAP
jgi:hypothetical protein